VVAAAWAFASVAAWAVQGNGLIASPDSVWPRWQGRLSLSTPTLLLHQDIMNAGSSGPELVGLSLLGDFYFARSAQGAGNAGGYRATSGLLLGNRSAGLLGLPSSAGLNGHNFVVDRHSPSTAGGLKVPSFPDSSDPGLVPYLGVGYTSLVGHGGWGFSADLGLMALSPGSIKLGRLVGGTQTLDDAVREMRLSPLLQVGVSYSF
jgi:hypothetical protein